MEKIKINKIEMILLVAILFVQSLFYIFMGNQKLGYHMDEIYSYGLSNSYEYQWAVIDEDKEYSQHEIFYEYVNVDEEHKLDYSIDWRNQAMDVHPPVYYVLMHTMSIIMNSDFTKWTGILLNIFIGIFITLGVYFLARKYIESGAKAIVISILYAFSIGMCNTVMYIRMYALFTVWAVWFTFLLYSTLKDDRKLDKKFGVKYIVLLTLGVMTQYYFLIFAFFVCLLFGIKIISEKRFIDLRNLFFYSIVSAVLCVLFFPYMLRHLVGGKRGKDSFVALVHFSEWIGDINDLFTTMCKQLYIGKIGFAIIGLIIIYIIYKKKKDIKKEYMYIFFIASVLFFIMISKIAPFASDRYIFGIYPIVFISTIGFVLKQIDSIFVKNNKTVFVILSCCMMLLTLGNYLINDVPYLYKENKIMWEYTEKNKDIPCLYVYEYESNAVYWDFPQIREYNSLKFIKEENLDLLSERKMNNYDEVIVYVLKMFDEEQVIDTIIEQNPSLNDREFLYSSNGANVYRVY